MLASRVLLVLLFCGMPAAPQQAEAPKPQQESEPPKTVIRVPVNEVIVPVTVTDDKGRFVSNLEAKDFRILDGGSQLRNVSALHGAYDRAARARNITHRPRRAELLCR